MKMIENLSKNIKKYVSDYSDIIILIIFTSYFKFFLYLVNYKEILDPMGDKDDLLSSVFVYSIFALSFVYILFLTINFFSFVFYIIFQKIGVKTKKPIYVIIIFLETLSYLYIYSDLRVYKLLGVHLHNRVIADGINFTDISKYVTSNIMKMLGYLAFLIVYVLLFLLLIFTISYIKRKFKLENILKKIMITLFIPLFLSLFLVLYFWINLYDELTVIPMWSYIESSHLIEKFESNYEDNFSYDKIKIKNKKNVIIIIAESFRTDVFNQKNTPNMFNFTKEHDNSLIKSEHHFVGAHFTINTIISLWYSIYGYHYTALFNNSNYKKPLPIKIFNKLGYKTSFFTTSKLIPSLKTIKGATEEFGLYKTFKVDSNMVSYFKSYYNKTLKEKPFLAMLFFDSTHYDYYSPRSIAKYKPYLKDDDITINMNDMDSKYKKELFNRYRNSVLYMDYLFKKVMDTLSEKDKKNTIVIFIGDHGEQFWEYGYLGHIRASYVKEVSEVPLIFYIPGLDKSIDVKISSHLDIMTTLLSYITNIKSNDIKKFFNGISLFDEKQKSNRYFIISSFRFMGLKNKIALINNYGKLILESKTNKIKDKNLFKVVKFTDFNDKELHNEEFKNKLLNSFDDFKKNYLRFIKMDKK